MPALDPSAARLLFLCVCCLPRRPATLSRAPAPAPESGHPSYLCLFTAPSLLCIRVPVPSGIPGGGGNCCALHACPSASLPAACFLLPVCFRALASASLLRACCPPRKKLSGHLPHSSCLPALGFQFRFWRLCVRVPAVPRRRLPLRTLYHLPRRLCLLIVCTCVLDMPPKT